MSPAAERFCFNCPRAHWAAVRELARLDGVSAAEWVRTAIALRLALLAAGDPDVRRLVDETRRATQDPREP